MNVIKEKERKQNSGGYQDLYNGLACIVGDEIVRLMQCEITTEELP